MIQRVLGRVMCCSLPVAGIYGHQCPQMMNRCKFYTDVRFISSPRSCLQFEASVSWSHPLSRELTQHFTSVSSLPLKMNLGKIRLKIVRLLRSASFVFVTISLLAHETRRVFLKEGLTKLSTTQAGHAMFCGRLRRPRAPANGKLLTVSC